jgi:hypothetical protein
MPTILIAAFLLLALYGLYLLVTGKDPEQILRREVKRLEEQNKGSAPVVYLRSCAGERLGASDVKAAFSGKTIPGTAACWKDTGDLVTSYLKVIGPPKELARPQGGSPLRPWSPSRPSRESVDDDQWQRRVLEWLATAALVVVQLDVSPGLGWELGQLVERVLPVKVLLVLPPVQSEYEEVRKWAGNYFPKPLPGKLPASRLMTFRPDWHPWPLEAQTGGASSFWSALEPVFEQNCFAAPPWRQIYGIGGSK